MNLPPQSVFKEQEVGDQQPPVGGKLTASPEGSPSGAVISEAKNKKFCH